jgi:hypothetical protein
MKTRDSSLSEVYLPVGVGSQPGGRPVRIPGFPGYP